MRRTLFFCAIVIILFTSCLKKFQSDGGATRDDETIYNLNGDAIAYCSYTDYNGSVVYLWNGKPTSYLLANDSELYGFNGKFLGWKKSGIYYDFNGKRIGFEKDALSIVTSTEPIKGEKETIPVTSARELKPLKPVLVSSWSSEQLDVYLLKGLE